MAQNLSDSTFEICAAPLQKLCRNHCSCVCIDYPACMIFVAAQKLSGRLECEHSPLTDYSQSSYIIEHVCLRGVTGGFESRLYSWLYMFCCCCSFFISFIPLFCLFVSLYSYCWSFPNMSYAWYCMGHVFLVNNGKLKTLNDNWLTSRHSFFTYLSQWTRTDHHSLKLHILVYCFLMRPSCHHWTAATEVQCWLLQRCAVVLRGLRNPRLESNVL